jgi:hypothetical protein
MNALIYYPYLGTGLTKDEANEKLNSEVRRGVIYLVVIGLVVVTAGYLQMCFWMWAGENQTKVCYSSICGSFIFFFIVSNTIRGHLYHVTFFFFF